MSSTPRKSQTLLYPVTSLLMFLLLLLSSARGFAAPLGSVSGLDHFAVNVTNLERATTWYADVFGFEVLHRWKNVTMVGRGSMKVGIFLRPSAAAIPDLDNKIAIAHVAFLIDGDKFDDALKRVKQMGVTVEGPEDTGIAYSFFVRDPDGNQIEVTTYHAESAASD
jgi:catechol-2,3-dioxygenase